MFHEDIFPFNLNTDKSYISPLPTELPQPNQQSVVTDDVFCTYKNDESHEESDELNHDLE